MLSLLAFPATSDAKKLPTELRELFKIKRRKELADLVNSKLLTRFSLSILCGYIKLSLIVYARLDSVRNQIAAV